MSRAALVLLAPLLLAGCAGQAAATPTPTALSVTGSVSVPPSRIMQGGEAIASGDSCVADGGYDDIAGGAQVVVSDGKGETLALGQLGSGSIEIPAGGAPINGRCVFPLAVDDVPMGQKFYGLHVGNTNRGTLQYTAKQMTEPVALTIG